MKYCIALHSTVSNGISLQGWFRVRAKLSSSRGLWADWRPNGAPSVDLRQLPFRMNLARTYFELLTSEGQFARCAILRAQTARSEEQVFVVFLRLFVGGLNSDARVVKTTFPYFLGAHASARTQVSRLQEQFLLFCEKIVWRFPNPSFKGKRMLLILVQSWKKRPKSQ